MQRDKPSKLTIKKEVLSDGRIVLTHGLVKKADRLSRSEIRKAEQIKGAFEEGKR